MRLALMILSLGGRALMRDMKFPVYKTKISGVNEKFDLNNPKERERYFKLKTGPEIKKLKSYFKKGNTFIAYLLGPKGSGKGTYSKLFAEVVGSENIEHFSVGDMIRELDGTLKDKQKKKELIEFLEKNYRGWRSIKELITALEQRSTKTLLPTELILTLAKKEIEKKGRKTLFIDGFPRDLDQISFTLFFRDLINYREDADIFVLIDVPSKVIDERFKYRKVCPTCQTSRNLKLFPTSRAGYDEKKKDFYLICDNPECPGQNERLLGKEGDDLGMKQIRDRLKKDRHLIEQAINLHGISKIFLRNAVPQNMVKTYVDDYEITPEYYYKWDGAEGKVEVKERPWVIKNDEGIPSSSLLAAPVVISLIKQLVDTLEL